MYCFSSYCKFLLLLTVFDFILHSGVDWEVRLPTQTSLQTEMIQPDSSTVETHPAARKKFNKSIANMVFMRGKDVHMADPTAFMDPKLYVNWVPSSSYVSFCCHPRPFNNYEKSMTLLSNSQSPMLPLNSVVDKAWNMFGSRAYVHQYLKFGMLEDDFVDSFACLEQVIKNYSCL